MYVQTRTISMSTLDVLSGQLHTSAALPSRKSRPSATPIEWMNIWALQPTGEAVGNKNVYPFLSLF